MRIERIVLMSSFARASGIRAKSRGSKTVRSCDVVIGLFDFLADFFGVWIACVLGVAMSVGGVGAGVKNGCGSRV